MHRRYTWKEWTGLLVSVCVMLVSGVQATQAATRVLTPPVDAAGKPLCTDTEEFENVANTLQPGDELILKGGVYCQTARRALTLRGTPEHPIVIRAAAGETPVITRLDDPTKPQKHNGIEILAEHAVIRGLRFTHGSAGVRLLGGSHHVTLEDSEISHTSNNAITLNSGSTDSCIIRRNHIHHTGLLHESFGTTEGEGLYLGCHNGSCVASNHLIEQNYIHHLRSTSSGGNDGVEVKYGSYGNVIRHNVIHDTTIGREYPCILVYGVTDPAAQGVNIVEGNALWNCGEAIQVVSDAIIRNNLILNSTTGISAARHMQVPHVRHVSIVNNTIVGHRDQALYIRWKYATDMVLANNAIYNPDGTALDARGLDSHPSITVKANYIEGWGAFIDSDQFYNGGKAADAFGNVQTMDMWPAPNSILRGKADATLAPKRDFNGTRRTAPSDVGAYETEDHAANPGWKIVPGRKVLGNVGKRE